MGRPKFCFWPLNTFKCWPTAYSTTPCDSTHLLNWFPIKKSKIGHLVFAQRAFLSQNKYGRGTFIIAPNPINMVLHLLVAMSRFNICQFWKFQGCSLSDHIFGFSGCQKIQNFYQKWNNPRNFQNCFIMNLPISTSN